MSFGERPKVVLSDPAVLRNKPVKGEHTPRKIERSGDFAGYAISGWRYDGLAIWHVKLWLTSSDQQECTYTVTAGEFHPESISAAEKFAVLRLLAMWEADGLR